MAILINVLLVIYVFVALLMILVILMQRPKSEGLGAAFGGGMTENLFGAQTTNVLVKFTGWLAGTFFAISFALSVLYAHGTNARSGLSQELNKMGAQAPAVPAAKPAPSLAVGAPNTVTNPTPAGVDGLSNGRPLTPADQAVGVTAPVAPPAEVPATPAPAASAQPSP
ncbi:MAG: preprotein translocase subunit SecG [Verrucomicrobiota bacterium]|nr:preprotein translocase subunit SecG [Verrucomicrobiota bacterium]